MIRICIKPLSNPAGIMESHPRVFFVASQVDLEGYQRAWRLRHAADDGLMLQAPSGNRLWSILMLVPKKSEKKTT